MLRRDKENMHFLPDVLLTCHQDDLDLKSFQIKNPTIIVAMLSEITESYDRNQKWRQYQKIKSLKYFLLISQVEYPVEIFSRPNDHTLFFYHSFEYLDAVIHFEVLGFNMSLKEIYEGISLEVFYLFIHDGTAATKTSLLTKHVNCIPNISIAFPNQLRIGGVGNITFIAGCINQRNVFLLHLRRP